ncbi:unnamed protein product [Protopolystoma xenopodis]|uniref:Uncharacterized protein n=1 Tax=Protopolystoma xenopodis TaxID=117903 RepID=A0A3S5FCX9_9PLAT|nr:unnamed protein product [Protopolystoma xenopodis]
MALSCVLACGVCFDAASRPTRNGFGGGALKASCPRRPLSQTPTPGARLFLCGVCPCGLSEVKGSRIARSDCNCFGDLLPLESLQSPLSLS